MSGGGGGGGGWGALKGLLFIIVILWVLWYFSGGPQRADVNSGAFMQPLAPLGNGQGYGAIGH